MVLCLSDLTAFVFEHFLAFCDNKMSRLILYFPLPLELNLAVSPQIPVFLFVQNSV